MPKRSCTFLTWLSTVAEAGRVALEDLNRHGTPVRSTKQSDHDLQFVGLSVPAVAELRQGAGPALEVGGGDVVEYEGSCLGGALQPGGVFDPFLLSGKPIHREVELVFGDRPKSENPPRLLEAVEGSSPLAVASFD